MQAQFTICFEQTTQQNYGRHETSKSFCRLGHQRVGFSRGTVSLLNLHTDGAAVFCNVLRNTAGHFSLENTSKRKRVRYPENSSG